MHYEVPCYLCHKFDCKDERHKRVGTLREYVAAFRAADIARNPEVYGKRWWIQRWMKGNGSLP